MIVTLHPNQPGYIITLANGVEYATQEGDQYYDEAHRIFTNSALEIVEYEIIEDENA